MNQLSDKATKDSEHKRFRVSSIHIAHYGFRKGSTIYINE